LFPQGEVLRIINVPFALCLAACVVSAAQPKMLTGDIDIQVKNIGQNGDEVTVLVELGNKSSKAKSFDHVEGHVPSSTAPV
jgi:hypothetical protein